MAMALALAERGLGNVWPNPAVGCVLVKDGRVVGRGWTQPGGRPHAESEAIARAGAAARGSTAYVTLEPCNHHGRTPPCVDAMLEAGIARTVIAAVDPDPRVNGAGIARLRAAGMEVTVGCREAEACRLNTGFFLRMQHRRPLVALKLATSADGRIATASGDSQWITGSAARAEGHRLRLRHDAILVGSGTALADDPMLTCRLPGLADRSPVRVVLDRRLRLGLDSQLTRSAAELPVWLFTASGDAASTARLGAAGVTRVPAGRDAVGPHAARGLGDAGGAGYHAPAGRGRRHAGDRVPPERLVDRLYQFEAPLLIGADGIPLPMPWRSTAWSTPRAGGGSRSGRWDRTGWACSSRCGKPCEGRMFTGIVSHVGEVRCRPGDPGRAGTGRRERPATARASSWVPRCPCRHLPDPRREGRADCTRSRPRTRPWPGPPSGAGARGSRSIWSARCGSATSWAGIWCSVMSMRWARSPASSGRRLLPARVRQCRPPWRRCWRSKARSPSMGSRSPSTRPAPIASPSPSSRIPGVTRRSPTAGSATRSISRPTCWPATSHGSSHSTQA